MILAPLLIAAALATSPHPSTSSDAPSASADAPAANVRAELARRAVRPASPFALLIGLDTAGAPAPLAAAGARGAQPCTQDADGDGVLDCRDGCPDDALKTAPGSCGCGAVETNTDADLLPDCVDGCPTDPAKLDPGACGCGVPETDTDGDETPDCVDGCPNDPAKVAPGECGCGVSEVDADQDGTPDCDDACPADPNKIVPGACGCGNPEIDADGDLAPDCVDGCPNDATKVAPGECGCGVSEVDADQDGTPDCDDACPADPNKIVPGACGCGNPETDADGDLAPDCVDGCPNDAAKIAAGVCGCGAPDRVYHRDLDGDGFGSPSMPQIACAPIPGYVPLGTDCDDTDARVHPCAVERFGNAVDDDCDASTDEPDDLVNPITCENALPANDVLQWEVFGPGDPSIQGFATEMSVDQGETVELKIKTDASSYRIDIFRLGYYGESGARIVATIPPMATLPQEQPACLTDPASGLVDCGNWAVSATWTVPPDATSGIYIARPVRLDAGHAGAANHVFFVVRDDDGGSELLFQTSDTTWQAYNSYGGASLYVDHAFALPGGRAFKVSYNRPFVTRANLDLIGQRSFFFNAEYPMVRWLEANGYDTSYCSGIDTDRAGDALLAHEVFLSVGHDEYWSGAQRANVEAARDAGVHLAFFSGNQVFWKTRFEPSIAASATPHRTLVCYKETRAHAKIDPLPTVWTGTWRDPRFSPPADGGRPENALTGTLFRVNGPQHDSIEVREAEGRLRFWRNTSLATLGAGQVGVLVEGYLGHEWNETAENGYSPPGLIRLSTTTRALSRGCLLDQGSRYGSGSSTHHLTQYRAASGAWVFSAGTVQWSWGLDEHHDGMRTETDVRVRQATVNLLADMGVSARSLRPGLVQTSASTDVTPPQSSIVQPWAGSTVWSCVPITISGTAFDASGGRVAAVEVSIDGGVTWHTAAGRESWSYVWPPGAPGPAEIRARAIDDSGNMQSAVSVASVTRALDPLCPVRLWGDAPTPLVTSQTDLSPIEVGVRFESDIDGAVTGLRFYKGTGNNGSHFGHLWDADGTLLGSLVFEQETAMGWQQAEFDVPIPIVAGEAYVASYRCLWGGYASTPGYFSSSGVESGVLYAPASVVQEPNGVFKYGPIGFPNQSALDTNYWVDVVFEPGR